MAERDLCKCGQPRRRFYWLHFVVAIVLFPLGLLVFLVPLSHCTGCGLSYTFTATREEVEAATREDETPWWAHGVEGVARRAMAGLLYAVLIAGLFLASCAGPIKVYVESPRWHMEEVGQAPAGNLFVAYVSPDQSVQVDFLAAQQSLEESDAQFRMPGSPLHYRWAGGGGAEIEAVDEADGSQVVRVFVTGDTPWSSLTEYRVTGNEVTPLRFGESQPIYALGVIGCPLLIFYLALPLRRMSRRLMGVPPGLRDL